jgi:hypothetical protein
MTTSPSEAWQAGDPVAWNGPAAEVDELYTKVLTRFAASRDLKLEVSFEAPVERDQAQSKTDETRSGLKELGLDDGVTFS